MTVNDLNELEIASHGEEHSTSELPKVLGTLSTLYTSADQFGMLVEEEVTTSSSHDNVTQDKPFEGCSSKYCKNKCNEVWTESDRARAHESYAAMKGQREQNQWIVRYCHR